MDSDRWNELERRRRSIAMLPATSAALSREEALDLIGQLMRQRASLRQLRVELGDAVASLEDLTG